MPADKPASGPSDFVTEAYNAQTDEELVIFYRKWAEDYDRQMLEDLGYISPRDIALRLLAHLDDSRAAILDLGCGTGLTVQALFDAGYRQLDGIDLSTDMVRVAAAKELYRHVFAADLNEPLDIADEQYDAAISSGTFTHGHVGPEPLDEILRILKPGGILACTVHFDLWESRGFADKFSALEANAQLSCLERKAGAFYESGKPEGWFCIYRKT